MSKPIPVGTLNPLSFEDRLVLVKTEVMNRIQDLPATEQNYQRHRLWIQWLKKNVLDVPTERKAQTAPAANLIGAVWGWQA